jgi:hypothetical protein
MKKIISGVVAFAVAAAVCVPAMAKSFSDVTSNWAWAEPAITEMSEMGLINGYPDGTFKPEQSVTHIEALALFARAMGSTSETNRDVVDIAVKKYESLLKPYSLAFGTEEVSFLLYRGALKESELSTYLSSNIKNEPMKRYEAAIIITKAMGAEEEAKANLLTDLSYLDAREIPSDAVQYVYYVTGQGLMQGTDGNKFSPNTEVRRSEIAVMLNNTVNMMGMSFEKVKLASINTVSRNIQVKESDGTMNYVSYSTDTVMNVEGVMTQAKDMPQGVSAVFTYMNDSLKYVDVLTSIPDQTVKGKFSGYTLLNGVLKISIIPKKSDGTYDSETQYIAAGDISMKYDGSPATINTFKNGDLVTLELSAGKVNTILGETKSSTITNATIEDVSINAASVTITISHASAEYNGVTFEVSNNALVSKNGTDTTLSKVYKGDKATLWLEYGVITKVSANSSSSSIEGTIQELSIGQNSKIKIKSGGQEYDYIIPADAKIVINDADGTLYDFRVGDSVKLTLESDAVTKIVATSVQAANRTVVGTVTAVNSSFGFVQISTDAGESINAFCNDNTTKFISASGSDKRMKNIEVGQTLTIRGSVKNGAFAATVIIIEE